MKKNFLPIVQRLKAYHPQKIFLFGSHAWGKPNRNSDIDLLIIKNTNRNYYERIPEARKYLIDLDSAFDILVLTPKELQHRLYLNDSFVHSIIEQGELLYEKN